MKGSPTYIQLLIILIASILFIPFLGHVHLFDWDEINFAEAAREMIVSKNYLTVQIDYHPFWEKPPLFIWMQVLSMKVFGINEFAARFPNAVCGIVTLLAIYRIGRKLLNNYFGLLWVLVYVSSILPFFYFKSGIIDPWFNLFIFLGIYYTFQYILNNQEKKKQLNICLSGVFIGLGILTKGPVALLIYGLTFGVFYAIKMFKVKIRLVHVLIFLLATGFVGGLWFILQIVTGHFSVVKDFFVYQIRLFSTKDAGHGGFLLYHFVVLFLGAFPASIFALYSFRREKKEAREVVHEFKNWMMILFWTVLILFTIVKTKIVHYSSMCYFPLTFLAAYVIYRFLEQKQPLPRWIKILILSVSSFWGVAVILLQLIAINKDRIIASGFIKDQFAIGNLQSVVIWSGYEFLIGLLFITAITLIYSSHRLKQEFQIYGTLIATLIFTYSTVLFITPRIEGYSQHSAIEFYKDKQKEDCYVQTLGFKSYAQLFYFDLQEPSNPKASDTQWLLTGDIDKPVYFVLKNTSSREYLDKYPQLKVQYEEGGFVFVKRDVNQ
jgi:4-amino-4-deoxy-L-arabinose transferase-like glycosyltransferase